VTDIVVGGNSAVGLDKTIVGLDEPKVGDATSAIGNVARGETGGDNSGSSMSEISLSVDEIDPSLDCSPLMQEKPLKTEKLW
jgi:hypothetical protein